VTTFIIDGKAASLKLRAELATQVAVFKAATDFKPTLAVVLVGEDPASQVYVRNKIKQTVEVGMRSLEHKLPASITQADLITLVRKLNADAEIDGILVQLPLPKGLDADAVIAEISPAKDVDGLTELNAGKLSTGAFNLHHGLVACTPLGSMKLIQSVCHDISGLEAVVIGRSNLFGKPMAQLLLQQNCTVTIAHSRTTNLPEVCRRADILVAAVGRAEMVKADWVKPGAIVIDVGINRLHLVDGQTKLVGDVDYEGVKPIASAITPVPGGVGPMTIACLLRNTLEAAKLRRSTK
jgi:methylenetetrahydrofolate dehydrogenase (NADP+) / methenyltetrahydrofolate cyclohydrolase